MNPFRHARPYLVRPDLRKSLLLGLTPALALGGQAVLAQSSQNLQLEEIIVTSRKRAENLQDLALSVSAMGEQEIQANFATDVRDLIFMSPNTVLDDTNQGPGGVAAAYIRGIGVSEVEKNFDPAVGVVIDDVFLGTMSGSLTRAIDLASVEVLRGPQGTLFGRNTIGGVIKMERSRPTMKFGGKVRASYGDYDTTKFDGLLNMGNGDTLGVKLTGSYHEQAEGFYDNVVTGRKDGQSEYTSLGVNVLWIPTDNFELELTAVTEETEQDSNILLNVGQPGQLFCDAFGYCSPSTSKPITGDRYKNAQLYENALLPGGANPNFDHNGLSEEDTTFDADTLQFEARWDINDDFKLEYIGALWETEEEIITDFDGTPDILFHTDRPAEYEQTTHELRLTYDAGGKLRGTVGAYSWDSEYEIRLLSWIGFAVPGIVLELPQTTNQESESLALFFEGDYDLSDSWTLTAGLRYTEDEKTTAQAGGVTAGNDEKWDELTSKLALKYDINDDSMVYGLYTRGYRAGGFNGRVDSLETATTPYDPETVDNFELGYRSSWNGNTLIFNATLFHMQYDDKQEEIQQPSATSGTGQVTRVVNAAEATLQGLELELTWLVAEGLTVRSNLGYLDAEYDDFSVNLGTSDAPLIADFSDLNIRRAPDLTFGLSANYEWDIGPGMANLWGSMRYLDEHEVDFANKPELTNDSQALFDASLTYEWDQFYTSVFGRNLTAEDGYQIGFDVAGLWSYAAPRAPRTWGIEIGMRFGEE